MDKLLSRFKSKKNICSYEEHIKNIPENEITEIITTLMSDEDIIKLTGKRVIGNFTPEELKKNRNSLYEGSGSLYDPSMGCQNSDICETCKSFNCNGHYGRIEFKVPHYNPLYMMEIEQVLKSVCNSCGKILINKDVYSIEYLPYERLLSFKGKDRLSKISEISKNFQCASDGCICKSDEKDECICERVICDPNPTFSSKNRNNDKKIRIVVTSDSGKEKIEEYKIEKVKSILELISDEDAEILGFAKGVKPINFIMNYLIVTPPNTRPCNKVGDRIVEDRLSKKYANIIRKNIENKGDGEMVDKELQELFKNKTDSHISNFPGIMGLLGTKKGIIREKGLGARVNFSGRSVVGPGDPSLKFGEISIPYFMKKDLTVPIIVNSENISIVKNLKNEGLLSYVVKNTINLPSKIVDKTKIEIGDKVGRHLRDGDIVLASRQPIIWHKSIMAFRVVINSDRDSKDKRQIKIHPSVTTPLNCDFDGDEMNIHVPQTEQDINEALNLMDCRKCILSEHTGKPSMGVIMDGISSAYILTELDDYKLTKTEIDEITSLYSEKSQLKTLNERLSKHGIEPTSGKGLFSTLLPEDFYFNRQGIVIKDGVLIDGSIKNKHIGPSGSIIEEIHKDINYGQERAADFINDATLAFNRYIALRGLTIGPEDCYWKSFLSPEKYKEEIKNLSTQINTVKSKVECLLEDYENSSEKVKEWKKNTILGELRSGSNIGANISSRILKKDNSIKIMCKEDGGGAKGSAFNTGQIMGNIEQQYYAGDFPKASITKGKRRLPHFSIGSTDIESYGYCVNSFWGGLTPTEEFFHLMGSREGLIDTGLETKTFGRLNRSVNIFYQNATVRKDRTVRTSDDKIVQFSWGGDGISPTYNVKVDNDVFFIDLGKEIEKINYKYR